MNLEIDHLDKNRSNNTFSNLKLVTKSANHEKVQRAKNLRRLTKEEVTMIRAAFEEEKPKYKIEWYQAKEKELGLGCWQTIQYNVLNYSNKNLMC